MALQPGAVLPSNMDQRQWAEWNRAQSFDTAITDAIADHVAASDPHPTYTTAAELAAALAALTVVASGTYTPTLFNTTNVTASTAYSCQYLRVGSVVTVSGQVDMDPTGVAFTLLGISLPIASAFANANELGGVGFAASVAGQGAAIVADVANARASFEWTAVDVAPRAWAFMLTYRII